MAKQNEPSQKKQARDVGMSHAGAVDFSRIRDSLCRMHDAVSQLANDHGALPAPGSKASTESATYPRPEYISTVQSQGCFLIDVGGDQMMAMVKAITEPVQVIAPWTCVRSLLESCALAAWLLDPNIDMRARVQRSIAYRFEGLSQQLKIAGVAVGGDVASIERRIDDVESDAIGMGFPRVVNKHGKRIGIGEAMPPATVVIRDMLDEEVMYRTLSAMAHGHNWAILALGFRQVPGREVNSSGGGVRLKIVEKHVNPEHIASLAIVAAKNLARALWSRCLYFGWDQGRLTEILDGTFDGLRARPETRFWKQASTR